MALPEMTGSISKQHVGYRIVNAPENKDKIDEITWGYNFEDITGDAALARCISHEKHFYAECGFSFVISQEKGTEEFDPPLPRIRRKGVALIRFRTTAKNCQLRSRFVVNVWT